MGAGKGLRGVLGFVKRGRLSFGRLTGGAGLPGLAQEGKVAAEEQVGAKSIGDLRGPDQELPD